MKNLIPLACCLFGAVSLSSAQGGAPPKPAPAKPSAAKAAPSTAPAAETGPAGGDLVQSILEQELDAPRNGYVYNPAGRRDPFVSLAKPVRTDETSTRPRRPGVEGFMLQEVSL